METADWIFVSFLAFIWAALAFLVVINRPK